MTKPNFTPGHAAPEISRRRAAPSRLRSHERSPVRGGDSSASSAARTQPARACRALGRVARNHLFGRARSLRDALAARHAAHRLGLGGAPGLAGEMARRRARPAARSPSLGARTELRGIPPLAAWLGGRTGGLVLDLRRAWLRRPAGLARRVEARAGDRAED